MNKLRHDVLVPMGGCETIADGQGISQGATSDQEVPHLIQARS